VKIAVAIKQVPDTESTIRISEDGKSIATQGIKWIINPYDEFAVEAALRLKEQHGGSVTIVSYGPHRVLESIRTALAMGADDAVLIGFDALDSCGRLKVARAFAAAVRQLAPDLALCGYRAVDYDMTQRGPQVAELLGWPHLPMAVSLTSDGSSVTIERGIEGGKVHMEAALPALVTVGGSHAVWRPRLPSLPGILKAKRKPVVVRKLNELGLDPADFDPSRSKPRLVRLEMAPDRKPGRIIDEGRDTAGKAAELVQMLHKEMKAI
jgi:electron transfer flavoprotein beta subunit